MFPCWSCSLWHRVIFSGWRLAARPSPSPFGGIPEEDLDRTSAAGKASAVQFIHFPFTDAQVAAFRGEEAEIVLGFSHPEYAHMAALPTPVRQALSQDFD